MDTVLVMKSVSTMLLVGSGVVGEGCSTMTEELSMTVVETTDEGIVAEGCTVEMKVVSGVSKALTVVETSNVVSSTVVLGSIVNRMIVEVGSTAVTEDVSSSRVEEDWVGVSNMLVEFIVAVMEVV